MKKRLVTFLLVCCAMMLLFAVPAMANTVVTEPVKAVAEYEISPRHEFTRIYWRNYNGQLQFRVWSMTNGIWLTDWIDL